MVSGISSSDEAKIGGITPDVLTFSGRCERSCWIWPRAVWRLGYWISTRRCARSMKQMNRTRTSASATITMITSGSRLPLRPPSNIWPSALRQLGDDAGHDDQRDAVADAAAGDLLAEPHQEHGAADQADHGR